MRESPPSSLRSLLPHIVRAALAEDVGAGDISSRASLPPRVFARAEIAARQPGVVAGIHVARAVFRALDRRITFRPLVTEGASVRAGRALIRLTGPLYALLAGERVALNFLARLSGIATLTRLFVRAARPFRVTILDTRKTTPLLRALEKHAVLAGGGRNHRFGLYDAVLLKDNHIAAAGSLSSAVSRARRKLGAVAIEVEAQSLAEVKEALAARVDTIMLDNFPRHDLVRAMNLIGKRARVEISGRVNLSNVRRLARLRPDFISVGALTHSALAFDVSMEILSTRR